MTTMPKEAGVSGYMSDIIEFHEKFGIAYYGPPRILPEDLSSFRLKFMGEELVEYDEATLDDDKVSMLDALVDLVYVALGTAHLHGFNFDEAWARVHRANMTKIKGPSERSAHYDVIKPPDFVKPDLSDLV